MIPFARKFHDDIKSGKITITYRNWPTLQLQKNKIYRSSNLGLLRVLDVQFSNLVDITVDELKQCGYRNLKEFQQEFKENSRTHVDFGADSAVRIEFEYLGEEIEDKKRLMGKVTPLELYEIKQKILSMEDKSTPPWVMKTLHALSRGGALTTKDLEKLLRMPPDKIRHRMRKLKEMSLLYSSSKKGYASTPLSMKVLKMLDKERIL